MLRLPRRTRGLTVGLLTFLYGMGVHSQAPPTALPSDPLVFVGSGPGGGVVSVFQADGTPVISTSPFGSGFTGGVRVAAGDINGDSITDVVTGMASGGGEVRAFNGLDGTTLGTSAPFGAGFMGGVFVAAGDVNADGHDDLLLGAGPGSGLARLIDGATQTQLGAGLPFPAAYTGGVTVAMGDVTGDGRADLIFGTAMAGFVRVFDGATLTELASGFPYGPLFFGGVNVAAGDVNGDGIDEVALAPRNSGGPVRVYNLQAELVVEGTPFSGVQGVSLALADLNADGRDDLVMGAGSGAQPRVRAFSIIDRTQLLDLLAFDAGFAGGVFVATPSSAGTRFTSANAATFAVGVAGSLTVTTTNGTDTVLSVGGTLPAGVTFTDNGNGTGTLAGTPANGTGGGYALNFVATRGAGQVASQPFTLAVQEGAGISSGDSATFATGLANVFAVTTTGHPAPTTIAVTGVLPIGVTFTNNGNGTGTLSGSPSAGSEGAYPLTITASNGIGSPASKLFTLTVVAGDTPLFSSANATTFTVGAVGSFSVLTSATPVASIITVTGALPAGVTFTNHGNGTATLAGVPDTGTAGIYPLVFTADNGVATTPQNFTLTVDPVAGGAPSFTSGNAITFVIGTAADFTATTTGFPVAATLTSSGALPAGITFTNNGDGTATLAGTADPGTAGSYPLQFTADNGVDTATQLFTLTINNISASPVFTSGATSAFVIGTSGTFGITTAASPAVTAITLTGTLPTGVIFTDNADGTASLDGTPQPGTAGPYPLTFTATNGVGAPVDQAFTLSVQEVATITSANARAFTVGIADSFTVTTAGLPVPSVALTTGTLPTGVTYTDNGDGTATIAGTAAPGTVGSYPLTLTATNGVGTPGTQAFTLAVTENTPPTLDAIPDPAAILEDAAQQTINLTGISAGLGDTQPLGVTATSSDPTIVPHPTVTYTTPNATGTLQYTPVPNASGSIVITVTVSDGGRDNDLGTIGDNGVFPRTFTVAVTSVNDPPTLDAIADPAAIDEDAAQQTINLTGIGTGGGETQTLQITATSGNSALIPDPTVTYTAPAATGSLAYTPVAGENGSAVITVIVTDGGDDNDLGTTADNLTATDTFTVTVDDVDDPPTLDAIPDPTAINEDAGLQTINLAGISAGTGEIATLVVTAVSGNTALIPNPTVTYASPSATGSLSYTPVANTSGSAVITVTVSDGGASPTQRTFTVLVNDVNDAPTFTPGGNQTVTEDAAAQTVNSFLGTVSAGANEASQIVTVTINNVTNPSLFTVAPAISATGVLTYTPAAEQFGVSTVTYTVADNGGTANGGVDSVGPLTFTITINAVNDPPTLNVVADPAAILEDAAQQTINLAGIGTGSTGESAQPLQVTAVSGNAGLIPNPTVTYVSPNATGSLAYTPVANVFGTAVITVTVTDGGLDDNLGTAGDNGTVVRTFTVNVTGVNDAPSFTAGTDQTALEDAGAQSVPWATGISEGPGESAQTVSFEITNNSNTALFSSGPSVSSTGVLSYTPAANQNGAATITLRITDDGGTANGGINASLTQTFTITVTAVNDAPVAQAKSYNAQANMQISGLSGLLTGVTDADSGINGCTPTFSVAGVSGTTPAGGNITNLNAAAGAFDFNPPPGVTGNVTFTYTVTDTGCPGTATSAAATVTINVAGPVIWFVNSAAPSNGDGRLTSPFQFLSGNAGADADDVDAANHHIFLYSGTYTGGLTLNANESLIGQSATGIASFDLLYGINPPAGTVARPTLGGTKPSITSSARGVGLVANNVLNSLQFDDTAGTAIDSTANVGTLTMRDVVVNNDGSSGAGIVLDNGGASVTASGTNTIATTTATALNVTNTTIGAAGLTFRSISAGTAVNGPINGIVLNTTGAMAGLTITGTGTAGSGGTIQRASSRGAAFFAASNISLSHMNFTTNGTVQTVAGSDATCGGNLRTGNNLACVGNIHLENVSGITLTNVNVTNSGQMGINGNNVANFTLASSTVTGNGNEVFEDGLTFQNLTGTATITNSMIKDNAARQINVTNVANNSTLTLGITGTRTNAVFPTMDSSTTEIGKTTQTDTFTDQSLLFEAAPAAASVSMTLNLTGVVFKNSTPGNSVLINPIAASGTFGGTTTDSSFDNTAGGVIIQAQNGMNGTYNVTNSEFNRVALQSILYAAANPYSGALQGTISGNHVGEDSTGANGQACIPTASSNCHGIELNFIGGSGSISTRIENNVVEQFGGTGIRVTANGNLSPAVNANIANNTVQNPAGLIAHGISTNIGTTSGANVNACLGLTANTINGTFEDPGVGTQFGILTNVRFSSIHRLPGYAGSATAVGGPGNAVTDFIIGSNLAGAKVFTQIGGSGTYPGGAACVTP